MREVANTCHALSASKVHPQPTPTVSAASEPKRYLPIMIVSGGQTGVDRGALDVAIDLGIAHGGWCPAGRIAEDGTVPSRYDLVEHDSPAYPARTEQNVVDADATLILHEDGLKGGTLLTKRLALKHRKPHLTVKLVDASIGKVRAWLVDHQPRIVNVAGPRESTSPGIEARTAPFLHAVFTSIHIPPSDSGD